jgi:hypothetical protein
MNVNATQEQDTSNNGSILSTIGGIIGLMVGGPTGAAIGSGMGSLAGGGSFQDAFRTGIMNLGIGALPGGQAYLAQNAIGQIFGAGGDGGGGQGNQMAQFLDSLAGGGGGSGQGRSNGADPRQLGWRWRRRCNEHCSAGSSATKRWNQPASLRLRPGASVLSSLIWRKIRL